MSLNRNIEIINKLGLHARAAAQFVQLASSFNSHIEIEKDKRRVNAKSIMGVMMLAAAKGSEIILYTEGDDEEESMKQLEQLINNRFNEEEWSNNEKWKTKNENWKDKTVQNNFSQSLTNNSFFIFHFSFFIGF